MSDLIQRQDAIEAVYEALRTPLPCYGNNLLQDSMTLAKAIVNNIPSANPKREKGTWIDSCTDIVCSICSGVFDGEIVYMCKNARLKYCPNCGARMEDE